MHEIFNDESGEIIKIIPKKDVWFHCPKNEVRYKANPYVEIIIENILKKDQIISLHIPLKEFKKIINQ